MLIALGRTTLVIAATCLAASPVSSQERQTAPDLSGTWVMDVARSASAAAAGHSMPDQKVVPEILAIQQTADELVIERRRGDRRDVISYSFAPASHAVAPPPAQPQPVGTTGAAVPDAPAKIGSEVQEARAEHKDGRVVIRLVLLINGKTVTTDDSLWLGAGGRELIVQRLLQVHHGYQGPGTKAASEAQDVYLRSDR